MMKNIYIVFLWVLALQSCGNNKNKTAPEIPAPSLNTTTVILTDAQLKNAAIETGKPAEKSIHSVIKLNGQVDVPPQSLISVSFPLGGYLKKSDLLPGTEVRKGQVIAVMEDQSYVQLQQDFLTAKAKMEFLSADMQRQRELSEQDASSKKTYQQVLSDYKSQQIIIKGLDEKLRIIGINPDQLTVNNISRTVSVHSPINGYVTKVNINVGKYVNPADVMFELVDPSDIHAAMTVFEKDVLSFNKGMKGKVFVTDHPNKQFSVEVILITRNISDSRTGMIHCHFQNPEHNLLPGMFLSGSFEVNNQNVIAVPEDAVLRYAGKQYVFIAKSATTFDLVEVETGISENGFIELKPKPGINWLQQTLVTKNTYALLGKLKNKIED
jgi:cobalt-zinc-cadmium efflux system membrane fusion protein